MRKIQVKRLRKLHTNLYFAAVKAKKLGGSAKNLWRNIKRTFNQLSPAEKEKFLIENNLK